MNARIFDTQDMKNPHLNSDTSAACYQAPDACLCTFECGFLIAQSPTGETYDDPTEYDGF